MLSCVLQFQLPFPQFAMISRPFAKNSAPPSPSRRQGRLGHLFKPGECDSRVIGMIRLYIALLDGLDHAIQIYVDLCYTPLSPSN
jgi:hypothetical protein